MKKYSILLIIILFSLNSVSQNLVRNWSFEDTISCPTGTMQINKALYWYTSRGSSGSSELYSVCNNYDPIAPGAVGVPNNGQGYQKSKLGDNYAGIYCYWDSNEYREYIETKLSQVMSPQINYYIEFWVSLSNESKYAIENIGAYFSRDTLHYSSNLTTLIDAQVEHKGGIISDTLNWVKVSGYFKPPSEGFQFLTIGNFQTDDSTDIVSFSGSFAAWGAYYYIENVAVIDSALQHTIGISNPHKKSNNVKLYPNPTESDITLEFTDLDESSFEIKIIDMLGKTVLEDNFVSSNKAKVKLEKLKPGVYNILIYTNGTLYETKTFIKH